MIHKYKNINLKFSDQEQNEEYIQAFLSVKYTFMELD